MSRPQDKNLIPFDKLSPEEAHAIRSAGGKASAAARKKRKATAELLQLMSELPITDKRQVNRLKKMGVATEDLVQNALVVSGILKAAQAGNFYYTQLYLELLGEMNQGGTGKENNLLSAIVDSTAGEVDVSDLPEIQQTADADADVVE